MDTFVDSSWYFYRFCDPRTDTGLEGAFRFLSRVWRMADHLTDIIRTATAATTACWSNGWSWS